MICHTSLQSSYKRPISIKACIGLYSRALNTEEAASTAASSVFYQNQVLKFQHAGCLHQLVVYSHLNNINTIRDLRDIH